MRRHVGLLVGSVAVLFNLCAAVRMAVVEDSILATIGFSILAATCLSFTAWMWEEA